MKMISSPGLRKRQLAQAADDEFLLELDGLLEDFRVGLEGDQRAGRFAFADDFELLGRFALLKLHVVDFAVARDFDLEPLRDRVDALGADAVRAAGEDVTALAILAAGVERGEHHLDAGDFVNGMDIDGNAAAFIADGNGNHRRGR